MMVGDNLGETQLQQLVDRQLAGQPRGSEDRVGRLAADNVVPDFLFADYGTRLTIIFFRLVVQLIKNLISYSFRCLICDDKKQEIAFPYF